MPARAGVGFKGEHAEAVCGEKPDVGWFEVHPENYMVAGGARLAVLEELRASYPLSLHGVGLSLGGAERLDADHLAAFRKLADRFEPELISEHIAWSAHGGVWFADLLPPSLSRAGLDRLCDNVDEMQETLGRPILIENPASYLVLPDGMTWTRSRSSSKRHGEPVAVSSWTSTTFTSAPRISGWTRTPISMPCRPTRSGKSISQGSRSTGDAGERLLIDSHGAAVDDAVWRLYDRLIARIGPRPTLVEWDKDIPDWHVLHAEAVEAETRLARLSEPVPA